jgi:putative flavoprotein involved in K+ transport
LEANRTAPQSTEMELLGEPKNNVERVINRKTINLFSENIKTVIAATGFAFDFSWVEPAILDSYGYPVTSRGTTDVPGLYFMGLNWMAKRKSGIIYGISEDADYLASIIISKANNI